MKWVELFLALRFLRPTRSYVSAITVLSLLGVIFGVMVLIVVLSVMEGFEKELRNKVIGFNSHLTVVNFGVVRDYDRLQNQLTADPRVEAASPFVLGPVLAEFHGKISTPFIKGIRSEESEKVIPLKKYLIAGEWLESSDTVAVGEEWAKRNDAQIGDKILIHSPRNLKNLTNQKQSSEEYYLPIEYRIVGIYNTGMFEYDFNFLLLSLDEAQRLYAMGESVHGIAVRLKDADQAAWVKDDFNRHLIPPLHARTWMDQNKQLFSAIALERRVMSFLLFFVMLVAAFGLSSTLITITVQKAKEIGLMKALGAQNWQIVMVFTLYGFVVGCFGAVLGTASGLIMVSYRNDFSAWLARTFRIEVFPAAIYNFSEIPAIVDVQSIFWIATSAIILSTFAALLPAALAARFDPVQTLRRE
ncbi:MAG: ABC transporter permease [Verrucomicrobiota bacterium]